MSWLLPGFLAGALAIGLPIALHFLRSKPTAVIPFPTLRFLGPSALRDTRRNRLRRWLTLLLRCLALILLAAAFARPFFVSTPPDGGRALLVVVDNSMSMQASGRWEALKKDAQAELANLRPGDRAGLLLMNPSPRWLVPMGDRIDTVRGTLRELQPGFETTRCQAALRLAGDALSRQPAKERVLFWMSDEQRLGWAGTRFSQPLPPGVKTVFPAPRPAPASQAAILNATVSGTFPDLQVEATVRLFASDASGSGSDAPVERTVSVFAAGAKADTPPLARKTVSLGRDGAQPVVLPLDFAGAKAAPKELQGLRVELDPDALPADDRFYVGLQTGGATGATLLLDPVPGVDFLGHALRSVATRSADATSTRKITPLPSSPEGSNAEWPARGVALLRGEAAFLPPQAARLDRFLKAGGSVWIFADGGPAQAAWLKAHGVTVAALPPPPAPSLDGVAEPRHLRDWDPEHPLLAAFSNDSLLPLLEVGFLRPYALGAPQGEKIASWDDGSPALISLGGAGNGEGGTILVAGFGLAREETDWPIRASFVPFVDQAIRWLAASHEERRAWRVGETIPLPEGGGTWSALDAPRAVEEQKVAASVRPSMPGLYRHVAADGTVRIFSVNPPAEESDLAPWPEPADFASLQSKEAAPPRERNAPAASLSAESEESQQRLWWWLIAAATLCFLAELGLANRTSAT